MAEETRTLKATCHCKASHFSFSVPKSSLPLPTHFCHCSICRRTHGTLATIHAPIPAPDNLDLSTFTAYASSGVTTRYFCSTCGAHMLDVARGEQWYVAASMVDAEEGVWEFHSHYNVESTADGGLASWVRRVGGKKLKIWNTSETPDAAHEETGDWMISPQVPIPTPQPHSIGEAQDKLKATCHCTGVQFSISRPASPSAFTAVPPSMTPSDKSKWYAIHDVCDTCRLVSGCAIVSWAFPPIAALSLPDGSVWPASHVFGTAKKYESSRGVARTFCGTCGAVVAYTSAERPGMVDVAVGLLDARGVRAEEWLEWRTGKVAYEKDCAWVGVLGGLKEGLEGGGDGGVGTTVRLRIRRWILL